jgi:hypothetical protein
MGRNNTRNNAKTHNTQYREQNLRKQVKLMLCIHMRPRRPTNIYVMYDPKGFSPLAVCRCVAYRPIRLDLHIL